MSDTSTIIRRAKVIEAPLIFQLCSEELYQGVRSSVQYKLEDFELAVRRNAQCQVIVAIQEYHLVGFLLAYDMLTWGYADLICVKGTLRGKGIAQQLVEFLEVQAPKHWQYLEFCYDPNDKSVSRLVEKAGFLPNFEPDTPMVWRHKPLHSKSS
jgi:ribosomal protein S18 acetylase RimI-like enzyme